MPIFVFIIVFLISRVVNAMSPSEIATEHYFDNIKKNPQKLAHFLYAMPKGGDLHNHLDGASMAENMFTYAKQDHFCINPKTFALASLPICQSDFLLANLTKHPAFVNTTIDAWSMRNFHPGKETPYEHFFATFPKFAPIFPRHYGEMLSEVALKACKENVLYLELMITPDFNDSGLLGKKIGWNPNLIQFRQTLLKSGLKNIVAAMRKQLDEDEKVLAHSYKSAEKNSCSSLKIRYIYQVFREQAPEQVFAQLLAGFELAKSDPRVVGINMVQAENGKIATRDYKLQMHWVRFLHDLYPSLGISLHAGELLPGLVSSQDLRFHIRDAVEIAQAKRIGHGLDIAYEDNSKQLLEEMAEKHILVEINLSSNAEIYKVQGKNHPILLYMQYGVPIALSTDDEGVLRTNLSEQYKQAVLTYNFSYLTLKKLARNSISYSFLPGNNLWLDPNYHFPVPVCRNGFKQPSIISPACQQFLNTSEKAQLQWQLESRFLKFENQFLSAPSASHLD
jgi:adenosine deaminase